MTHIDVDLICRELARMGVHVAGDAGSGYRLSLGQPRPWLYSNPKTFSVTELDAFYAGLLIGRFIQLQGTAPGAPDLPGVLQ